jgi:hypothetical protein
MGRRRVADGFDLVAIAAAAPAGTVKVGCRH